MATDDIAIRATARREAQLYVNHMRASGVHSATPDAIAHIARMVAAACYRKHRPSLAQIDLFYDVFERTANALLRNGGKV